MQAESSPTGVPGSNIQGCPGAKPNLHLLPPAKSLGRNGSALCPHVKAVLLLHLGVYRETQTRRRSVARRGITTAEPLVF